MTSSPQDAALNKLQRGLSELITRLQSSLGETLISVILYGGVARGRFDPAVSDVNLMLVLSAISIVELDKIAAAAAPTRLEYQLSLLTVTETDLGDSAEVFPTKFLDIRRHHERFSAGNLRRICKFRATASSARHGGN